MKRKSFIGVCKIMLALLGTYLILVNKEIIYGLAMVSFSLLLDEIIGVFITKRKA